MKRPLLLPLALTVGFVLACGAPQQLSGHYKQTDADFAVVLTHAELQQAASLGPALEDHEVWTRSPEGFFVKVDYHYPIEPPRSEIDIRSSAFAFSNEANAEGFYKGLSQSGLDEMENNGMATPLGDLSGLSQSRCVTLLRGQDPVGFACDFRVGRNVGSTAVNGITADNLAQVDALLRPTIDRLAVWTPIVPAKP